MLSPPIETRAYRHPSMYGRHGGRSSENGHHCCRSSFRSCGNGMIEWYVYRKAAGLGTSSPRSVRDHGSCWNNFHRFRIPGKLKDKLAGPGQFTCFEEGLKSSVGGSRGTEINSSCLGMRQAK